MMKRMLMLVLPLVAALMFGCQNTPFSLDEGRYIPEQSEKDDMAVPYLLIGEDNRIEVIQDILVSYQPSGTMTLNRNEVILETEFADRNLQKRRANSASFPDGRSKGRGKCKKFRDSTCKWTFELIDNNKLKFVSAKSSVPYKGELWEDGMVFVLAK